MEGTATITTLFFSTNTIHSCSSLFSNTVFCFVQNVAKFSHTLGLTANRGYELIFSLATIDIPEQIWMIWWRVRERVMIPMMNIAVILCLIMSIMVLVEKVSMGAVSLYAKIFRRRPERIYKCDPIVGDEETGNLEYPMVLIQIPMYNEKEVCICVAYHLSFCDYFSYICSSSIN